MAKIKSDVPISFYSAVIIDKAKQTFLGLVVIACIAVVGSIIFENIIREGHWLTVSIPITIIGSILALFPPTETWTYQAWQSKPRMYEKHLSD